MDQSVNSAPQTTENSQDNGNTNVWKLTCYWTSSNLHHVVMILIVCY